MGGSIGPRIAFTTSGEGDSICFLHGLGSTKESWSSQIEYFASRYRAVAWDARGYGDSDNYAGDLHFCDDYNSDLEALLDKLGIERVHLVGLSMGGLIAQNFYFLHRSRVRSLVLANSFPEFSALGVAAVERFRTARLEPLLNGADPRDLAEASADFLLAPHASDSARKTLISTLSGLRRESYVKSIKGLLVQSAVGVLAEISVPTLVVTGAFDRLCSPSLAAEMAFQIAGSELVKLPMAGHLSNIEDPDGFNRALDEFYARHFA